MNKQNIPDYDPLFLNDLDEAANKETSLWRSVILQALMDARLPESNREYILWKRQALEWFNVDNEDFLMVCYLAQVSSQRVLLQLAKAAYSL